MLMIITKAYVLAVVGCSMKTKPLSKRKKRMITDGDLEEAISLGVAMAIVGDL